MEAKDLTKMIIFDGLGSKSKTFMHYNYSCGLAVNNLHIFYNVKHIALYSIPIK